TSPGARSGSRSVAASGTTDQVDRFAAVAIDDFRVSAFLKQVANEIRSARLRRDVKSRHAFVRRGRASETHGICLRTGDLSIYVRAVPKKHVHERRSLPSARAASDACRN